MPNHPDPEKEGGIDAGQDCSPDTGLDFPPEAHARQRPLETALYVVATPIGNLRDISLRALDVLKSVDCIACEDKRVTTRLLQRYAIATRMLAYHDHNADKQGPAILSLLQQEKSVALVSDAGTPLISDPGFRLINEVVAAGFKVVPVPGPSSPIAALSVAGLPTDTFLFAGFLPPKSAARRTRLKNLAAVPATLVFLESPKRLKAALADCASVLGEERAAAVGREITKLYETFSRDSLGELAARFGEAETPKGEIVLMIGPPGAVEPDGAAIDTALRSLMADHPLKTAAAMVADAFNQPKRDIYQRALLLKQTLDERG
ncbi:MAG: 16S rRNA (cytidine(1402)-2'-O)-methyltransferase [Rhizobiales bacterium]|nr:16S rRNA (cytidine(1402)-2'-O)-methyltransferase [Hyphomicrobiales bacterium]